MVNDVKYKNLEILHTKRQLYGWLNVFLGLCLKYIRLKKFVLGLFFLVGAPQFQRWGILILHYAFVFVNPI